VSRRREASLSFDQLAQGKQWLLRIKRRLKTDPKYKYRGVGNIKYRTMRTKPPNPDQRSGWMAVGTCIELLEDIRRETLNQKSNWFVAA